MEQVDDFEISSSLRWWRQVICHEVHKASSDAIVKI